MTLRLFGNIFSGGLMLVVMLTLLPVFITPPLEIVWKFFDAGLLGHHPGLYLYVVRDALLALRHEPRREQQHASHPEHCIDQSQEEQIMATDRSVADAIRNAGALVGGGLALGGGAIGAAIGDGLAGSQTSRRSLVNLRSRTRHARTSS